MSKLGKQKQRDARRAEKAKRKAEAYKRCGPKSTSGSTKAEKRVFKPGASRGPVKLLLSHTGFKKKAKPRPPGSNGPKKFAKRPLRPLRKRRHLNTKGLRT